MEARLQEVVGDEKKTQGIKKGIANLEARIANPKQIQLWNKLTSDVVSIERLGKEPLLRIPHLLSKRKNSKPFLQRKQLLLRKI